MSKFIRFVNLLSIFLLPCLQVFAQVKPNLLFNAKLDGGQHVPAVATAGAGMVTLLFSDDLAKVKISGLLTQMSAGTTEIGLFAGKTGQYGPQILDLKPFLTGRRIAGETGVPAGLLEKLLLGQVYADVKTSAFSGGEIRGQFAGEADVNFAMLLRGSEQVPATNSSGLAFGGLHLATGSDDMEYIFLVRGLSGPITSATLHKGNIGQNGPPVADLAFSGNIVFGLIDLDDLGDDFIADCIDNQYYVSIQTSAFPSGEVRGQLRFLGYLNAFSPLNGLQVVPSASTTGYAFSATYPNATLDSLITTVLVNDAIAPASVQVRVGDFGSNGSLSHSIEPSSLPGVFSKTYPVSASDLAAFTQNRLYLTCPTAALPNGEIRGQLRTSLRKCYAFDLCGSQVVPGNPSTALGMGMASVDVVDCYIHTVVIADGLAGSPTGFGLFAGPAGANGNLLYPFPAPDPCVEASHELAPGEGQLIENQGTYMSIASGAWPNGEIRGQVRRELTCPLVSGTSQALESNPEIFPNPFSNYLKIKVMREGSLPLPLSVQLFDAAGQKVLERPLPENLPNDAVELATQPVSPGVYFVKLVNTATGEIIFTKQIVK